MNAEMITAVILQDLQSNQEFMILSFFRGNSRRSGSLNL